MAFTDSEIAEAHEAGAYARRQRKPLQAGLDLFDRPRSVDLVQAHMWFNLAASRGSEAAKECRRELADMMSKDLIAEAQRARPRVAFG